mgnify:CR=1 FL=1
MSIRFLLLVLLGLLAGCPTNLNISQDPKSWEGDNADECRDGADNNADGLFDCDDVGCQGSPDCQEGDHVDTTTWYWPPVENDTVAFEITCGLAPKPFPLCFHTGDIQDGVVALEATRCGNGSGISESFATACMDESDDRHGHLDEEGIFFFQVANWGHELLATEEEGTWFGEVYMANPSRQERSELPIDCQEWLEEHVAGQYPVNIFARLLEELP